MFLAHLSFSDRKVSVRHTATKLTELFLEGSYTCIQRHRSGPDSGIGWGACFWSFCSETKSGGRGKAISKHTSRKKVLAVVSKYTCIILKSLVLLSIFCFQAFSKFLSQKGDSFAPTSVEVCALLDTGSHAPVMKKCCIFLKRLEIQDGCPDLWLAEIFSISPGMLHVKSVGLLKMFLYVHKKCCWFSEGFKIRHGRPVSDWLKHVFTLLLLLHLKSPELL